MEDKIRIFKALSDKNRLLILDMLSCGELCACDIMDGLNLTQPTISHHMKILQEANLVIGVKKGKWMVYSINRDKVKELTSYIKEVTSNKDKCICKSIKSSCSIEE
ncbi:winged helix-turn-helix transcriptional regulator [Clostridium sp. D2Q-14]|uniref:ArsR/SmtB family transcription factor n=1 Tax=Anaeromonas gelatinilytica TaxID=2683194 RepID=UPI00193C6643|nr:metalloregulator ArsR/SmtB family transcription factor [Anaeromonas gelatinilytica]MBS4534443.1 winged helix-turn-helix transcriptional regulator [Anaeromonas gelatinilytica]